MYILLTAENFYYYYLHILESIRFAGRCCCWFQVAVVEVEVEVVHLCIDYSCKLLALLPI